MSELPPNAVLAETREDWRAWLAMHHTQAGGVWLVLHKKGSGTEGLEYAGAVEEALCFGWIDSKGNVLDDERWLLWMAPRKKKTGWSQANKERVERMIAAGKVTQAGLAKIEAAKEDGSWDKIKSAEALEIPPDLAALLEADPVAKGYFDAFPRPVKRSILEWIGNARRPETRQKRLEETARLAARNIRANQWRQ